MGETIRKPKEDPDLAGGSGNFVRKSYTNKRLAEDVDILQDMIKVLDDIINQGYSCVGACRKNGLKYYEFRQAVKYLEKTPDNEENRIRYGLRDVSFPEYFMTESERGYAEIFAIKNRDYPHIELPFDYEETFYWVLYSKLSISEVDFFKFRLQYGPLTEFFQQFNQDHDVLTEKRECYRTILMKLRTSDSLDRLSKGKCLYEADIEVQKQIIADNCRKQREKSESENQNIQEADINKNAGISGSSETKSEIKPISISLLGLSQRAYNALMRAKVKTIEDLAPYMCEQKNLSLLRNVGRKTIQEIQDKYKVFTDREGEINR